MKQAERDNEQLGIIVKYCERIETARQHFGNDFELFSASTPYQDSCSLCLIQIGEAVGRLSDEYRGNHPQIDWRAIYGMRCHCASFAKSAFENRVVLWMRGRCPKSGVASLQMGAASPSRRNGQGTLVYPKAMPFPTPSSAS